MILAGIARAGELTIFGLSFAREHGGPRRN